MHTHRALVREIALYETQQAAWLTCPKPAIPAPGQYMLATSPATADAALASVLFPAGYSPDGFLAAPPLPQAWLPGVEIHLHGPLGHGFDIPTNARRLALGATGSPLHVLALLTQALANGSDVALFCDQPPAGLPGSVEVNRFSALPEGLAWADYAALAVSLEEVQRLPGLIGERQPCPAQVLVLAPMPCAGMAGCGVCAVQTRRGQRLACEDGPVFRLFDLLN